MNYGLSNKSEKKSSHIHKDFDNPENYSQYLLKKVIDFWKRNSKYYDKKKGF